FCSSRRRHTRSKRDWSSDVCSSDLFVVPIYSKRYACLVNLSPCDNMEDDLLSIAQKGKDFLEQNFQIYSTISISSIHSELPGIRSEERRVGKECWSWRWAERGYATR